MATPRLLSCTLLACLVSLSVGGCGDGDGVDVEALADGAIAASARITDALGDTCSCAEEFGFSSEQECMSAIGSVDLTIDRQCTIDALNIDPEAAKANFDCESEGLSALAECFESAINACDQEAFTACNDMEEPTCPEIPKEMDDALDECIE